VITKARSSFSISNQCLRAESLWSVYLRVTAYLTSGLFKSAQVHRITLVAVMQNSDHEIYEGHNGRMCQKNKQWQRKKKRKGEGIQLRKMTYVRLNRTYKYECGHRPRLWQGLNCNLWNGFCMSAISILVVLWKCQQKCVGAQKEVSMQFITPLLFFQPVLNSFFVRGSY